MNALTFTSSLIGGEPHPITSHFYHTVGGVTVQETLLVFTYLLFLRRQSEELVGLPIMFYNTSTMYIGTYVTNMSLSVCI